jgi:transcriptional regulator with XRE-family HTH domain
MSNFLTNNIKKLRESAGHTQEYLADMLGVSRATFSKIELGTKEAGINTIMKLSEVYKVTTDQLLGNDIKFLTPNNIPTEFRDYLYINQDKLKSYLGSLGHSDIGKILHTVSHKHDLKSSSKVGLEVLGNGVGVNGDINREKNKKESWEESKQVENFANTLMTEFEKQGFVDIKDSKDISSSGKFIKIKTDISFVGTAKFMNNLFTLIETMKTYGVEIPNLDNKMKPFLDLIAKDIGQEVRNKKISFSDHDFHFYGDLKNLKDEFEESIEGSVCTVIAKIVKVVNKPNLSILELKSLNILPPQSKFGVLEALGNIPSQMNHEADKILMFYPEDSIIVEPIFIYQ